MGWLSSIETLGSIVESKKYLTNYMFVVWGTVTKWKQTRTVTQITYPGLTQAAAETAAATMSADANCTDAHTQAAGGGQYVVSQTIDEVGDWEEVAPPPAMAGISARKGATSKRFIMPKRKK